MPTRDRRPRRRVKPRETDFDASTESFNAEARIATKEDSDGGLRRRFVRHRVENGLTPDIAAGIVRAYERSPQFIPQRPPNN